MSFFGLLKSEEDTTTWCSAAKDFLGFVGDGMSEREARDRARVSADQIRQWKRIPGFREAIRRARSNGGGLTAKGVCNLAQVMPPETDVEAGERERREWERVDPPGSLWGPQYGPGVRSR
jgi:hypothetical protein